MDVTARRQCRRVPRLICRQRKQGRYSKCSNSTSTDRPTRPRSRCSSRKPASPIEPVAVDTRKGDQFKPEYLADQSERQGAGDRRRRRQRVRQQRHPALPRREDRQVPACQHAGQPRRVAVVADVRRHRRRPVSPARPCTSSTSRRRRSTTPTTATSSRRSGTYGILNDHLAKRRYMVGDTYTIVDMDVWGWARMMPFVHGRGRRARNIPTSSGWSTRSSAPPAAAKRDRAEGQASPSRPRWTTRPAAIMFKHHRRSKAA